MLWFKQINGIIARIRGFSSSAPLILLVTLTLIRGLIYLSIFPPFLAPDEAAHFEAIRLIGQENRWPTRAVYLDTPMHPEMAPLFERFRIWNLVGLYSPTKDLDHSDGLFIHYYSSQVSATEIQADSYLVLYHLSMAPLSAVTSSLDLVTQVYILRFISVIFAALTVIAAWFTVKIIFPERNLLALGACTFIVFWPMHSHVTASINSDSLAEFIGALFFLVLVRTLQKNISILRGILLLAVVIVGILTKPTLFFLLPTLMAVALIYAGRNLKWSNRVIGLLIGIEVVLTWIGAFFLHESSGGGRRLLTILPKGLNFPEWSDYITSKALFSYVQSLNFAVVSFGGLFGWSNIHIPWAWVRVWAVLILLVLVGVVIFVTKNLLPARGSEENFGHFQRDILLIFLLAINFALVGLIVPVIIKQSPSWGIHSRYYFPVIVPLALYTFLGTRQLIPSKFRKFLWPGWLVGWSLYDAVILVLILLPFLYS